MKTRRFWMFAVISTVLLLVLAVQRLNTRAESSMQKGISYVAYESNAYLQPDADLSLEGIASTGANWIAVSVIGYQDTISSTAIFTTTATATDADLIHVIAQAHSLGLRVMLKPHVGILGGPNRWAGQIGQEFTTEAEWSAWFASYRSFVEHYADLSEIYGADQLSVGCELVSTTHRAGDWRALIAGVRARYGGPIAYAANHSGEETSITWWDAVDYIGVDAFYPLTDKNDPTLDELKAAWAPHVSALADLSATWDRPILFTEIGYRSLDGTNQYPWNWQGEGTIDFQEQADAYQAAFESVWDQPWFAGMYWWEWGTDPFQGGPCDDGYTPHDKLAEDVLRAWYGGPPRPIPTPVAPDYTQTMHIYTDMLGTGWEDWSWGATRNLAATDQVYSGTHAISVTLGAWGALSFWHPAFDSAPYYWLEFYVRGFPPGEQHLWALFYEEDGTELRRRPVDDCRYMEGGTIEAGTWKRARIPLSHLNAADRTLVRVSIQDRSGQAPTGVWVDEIRLVGAVTWRRYLPMMLRNG
jgi:hypothetical protein